MKVIGYGVMAIAVVLGAAAALALTWFFLVGGILDLADGRVLTSGLARVDEWNREYADRWGRTRLGLVKIFVLEPLAIVLVTLVTRALLRLGRALVRQPAREAPAPPAVVPPADEQPAPAGPEPESEPDPAPEPTPEEALVEPWDEPSGWELPPLPAAIGPEPASEAAPSPEMPPEPVVPAAETATGGEAISIPTLTSGATLEVSVRAFVDPIGSPPPDAAERYVAVLVEIRNAGQAAFDDLPTGGAFVIGSDDARYRTGAQRLEPALREISLAAGERCEGYLSFKLPVDVRPVGFRYTPNMGLAPETGEWELS